MLMKNDTRSFRCGSSRTDSWGRSTTPEDGSRTSRTQSVRRSQRWEETSGIPGGSFELVIVDEDSKIDANLGASNDIAHIRLAKELMGVMSRQLYDPMFQQRDSRNQPTISRLLGAPPDELFSCDLSSNAPPLEAEEDACSSPASARTRRSASLEELR